MWEEIKIFTKKSLRQFLFWTCQWKEQHKTVAEEQPNWRYCPLCWEALPSLLIINNIEWKN